jgi:hypothetical protein
MPWLDGVEGIPTLLFKLVATLQVGIVRNTIIVLEGCLYSILPSFLCHLSLGGVLGAKQPPFSLTAEVF